MSEITEKEIEAAMSGWHRALIDAPDESVYERRRRCVRAALEAAARVRAEANVGGPVKALADALRGLLKAYENAFDWSAELPPETVEAEHIANEVLYALTAGKPHPDDEAVDRFAAAMKAKLKWEREERGRYGWNDPEVCSEEYLAKLLIEHLEKSNEGNFEDVANICMMLHQRGAHPRVLADVITASKPEPSGWQPIETAPRDGTEFQAWIEKYGWEPRARFNPDSEAFELYSEAFELRGCVDYDKDAWDVYPHMVPTHWMPLPTPPTTGGSDE